MKTKFLTLLYAFSLTIGGVLFSTTSAEAGRKFDGNDCSGSGGACLDTLVEKPEDPENPN